MLERYMGWIQQLRDDGQYAGPWKPVARNRLVPDRPVAGAVEERSRLGHGRLVAALMRRFGVDRLPLVENAVQDAYVRAMERWPDDGTPLDADGRVH